MQNHEERLNKKQINLLNILTLLMGFSSSLVIYIISSYFKAFSGKDDVTIYFIAAYLIVLLLLFKLHKIIKIGGGRNIFLATLLLLLFTSLLLSILPIGWPAIVILIANIVLLGLSFAQKDSLLEACSTDKMSGRIRGLHLTLMNVGYILAPFLSMGIVSAFGFKGVFLLQFAVVFIMLLISFFKLDVKLKDIEICSGKIFFKKLAQKKDILNIYYISFILDLFYFFAVVFVPIHLRNLGMEWSQIGLIFTFMLLPFVLIEYPLGMIADKKMGEKELLIIAIVILAISSGSLYFINSTSLFAWGAILFTTRIGAASLEMLRDSYFYKKIDGADVNLINFFRTTNPAGYIIGSIIAAAILFFFPLKVIFIFMFFATLSGLFPAFALKDNKSEEEVMVRVA